MKRNKFEKQIESASNVTMLSMILLIILTVILFESVNAQEYGYLVSVDYKDKMIVRKVKTVEQVETILNDYFPKSEIHVEEFLKGGVYFEMLSTDMRIYVERKKIVVKKNGKVKYRKIKRRRK